jgi:hypothetical protein
MVGLGVGYASLSLSLPQAEMHGRRGLWSARKRITRPVTWRLTCGLAMQVCSLVRALYAHSAVSARGYLWSYWLEFAHRLVGACTLSLAHAACSNEPTRYFLLTFWDLYWTRYTSSSLGLSFIGALRRIQRLVSPVGDRFLWIGVWDYRRLWSIYWLLFV